VVTTEIKEIIANLTEACMDALVEKRALVPIDKGL
jgi:hypothetical protein